jgi:hypothetical protein
MDALENDFAPLNILCVSPVGVMFQVQGNVLTSLEHLHHLLQLLGGVYPGQGGVI